MSEWSLWGSNANKMLKKEKFARHTEAFFHTYKVTVISSCEDASVMQEELYKKGKLSVRMQGRQ